MTDTSYRARSVPITDGYPTARVWIVGEAPGQEEAARGRPFIGPSGMELNKLLAEAGTDRSECFLTNVVHERPPSYLKNGAWVHNDIDQWFLGKTKAKERNVAALAGRYPDRAVLDGLAVLRAQLERFRPAVVLAAGNTAMWALTSHDGVTKWRGSLLDTADVRDRGPAVPEGLSVLTVPTFHPADVLRQWTHRPIVLQDIRRAVRESRERTRRPEWHFTIPTSVTEVYDWFADTRATVDAQTSSYVCDTEGWGRVDCIGFASSSSHAICIPFKHETGTDTHYWSEEDESRLLTFLRDVLSHNAITFHNALWDCQVIAGRWGFLPRLAHDTQVMQHVAFPGLIGGRIDPVSGAVDKRGSSLSLSFIASMYCQHYRYWKDDGRHFDPSVGDERDYWRYNCEDCARTWECRDVLTSILDRAGLTAQYEEKMLEFGPTFAMMFRGIRYDRARAREMRDAIVSARDSCKTWLDYVTDTDFNPNSAPQCRDLFYTDLRVPLILNKDTKSPTTDDTALAQITRRNPRLWPLTRQIANYRTLDTVKDDCDPDFASADGRVHSALNVAFVETMRFSSNEDAFGRGGNVQNIKRNDGDV